MLSKERIAEIEGRIEKATGGKWWWRSENGYLLGMQATRISPWSWVITWAGDGIKNEGLRISAEDMAFIAHARQDIPDLLADNAELRKRVEAAEDACVRMGKDLTAAQESEEKLESELARLRKDSQ